MKHVAGYLLAVEHEFPEQEGLFRGLDAQSGFHALQRRGGVARGTDAADAARDVGGLVVAPAAQHSLEETRRFDDLPLQFLDDALPHVEHDVAVPFDARHVVHVHVNVLHGLTPDVSGTPQHVIHQKPVT